MYIFKLASVKAIPNYNNTILDRFDNIEHIYNTINFCFSNKLPVIITDKTLTKTDFKSGINIIYNKSYSNISWNMFINYNEFFSKKYKINEDFSITNNIFNIFFILFIDKNYKFLVNNSRKLVSNKNSIFSVINTFDDFTENSTHLLYFSFNIGLFILYRVYLKNNYIIGKLLPSIKYKNNKLIASSKIFNCPKSFLNIKDNIFAIKKTSIDIEVKQTNYTRNNAILHKYSQFITHFKNYNIYIINLERKISKNIITSMYKYLLAKFPDINDATNNLIYDKDTIDDIASSKFSIVVEEKNNIQSLVIYISQSILFYITHIIDNIDIFLSKIGKNSKIIVKPEILYRYHNEKHIHLVSEIYFIITFIILYLPKIYLNIKSIDNTEYTQANYVFDSSELEILYKNKNDIFIDNAQYLKTIIIKALSIFMENYYCIIHEQSIVDLIPIYDSMSNSKILNLLERSQKAGLSKNYLLSFFSSLFLQTKNKNIELPIIIFNINKYDVPKNIDIKKVYSKNVNKNIPIFINIIHGKNNLHISLSYSKRYEKLKVIFNDIITQLLN